MDINTLFTSNNSSFKTNNKINGYINNKTNNKTNNKINNKQDKLNLNKQKNQKNIVFMDIDVNKGMCQGIYFSKSNIALKCNKPAKFCKSNQYMVCEKHKHQVFGN